MKHACIRYFILLLTFLSCTIVKAGNIPSGFSVSDSLANGQEILCRFVSTARKGSQLTVHFTLDLTSLSVLSNRLIRLTPLIRDSSHVRSLLPVVISGRRQNIMYERMSKKQTGETPYRIRRKNKTAQSIEYHEIIPYESWMNGAHLIRQEDLCGCGKNLLQHTTHLKQLILEVALYTVQPQYKFMVPAVETLKKRAEAGQAFLDFPSNKTRIYPQYRNNPIELDKIHATIDVVKNDSNIRITGIHIHGYASPEGKYENNSRLARERAEALKNYVRRLYHFENRIFSVKYTAEDWEGLSRFIRESRLTDKVELLAIIRETSDPEEREKEIAALNKNQSYHYMSANWFPLLRHCDYRIEYIVRSFVPDEAKKIIKKRPQLLSLDEMFSVAHTYQAGSEEFNEVFDIAVRMFPENPVANLNAANAAMLSGNLDAALNYLAKAGNSPEALHAQGIYALLQNNFEKAERLLGEAQAKNIAEATFNLQELQKKKENQLLIEQLNHE